MLCEITARGYIGTLTINLDHVGFVGKPEVPVNIYSREISVYTHTIVVQGIPLWVDETTADRLQWMLQVDPMLTPTAEAPKKSRMK